ncbi:hypothetical protein [Paenibacillus sp. IHBB 3054]|uniref:hypothetical protein n=1 Tax=Paenibacillus sp. IHBB 3054 TaxID=3425689 RepID=UPI003F67CBF1
MNYLILSSVPWDAYKYKRLLDLLPDRGEVLFAGGMTPGQQEEYDIQSLCLAEIYKLNAKEYTVLVSSPYWLPDVMTLEPAYTVALLEACPEGEDSGLWDKYSALLAARADLVATASERLYLEQNLRREGVVYLSGDSLLSYGIIRRGDRLFFLSGYEAIWTRALGELWQPSAGSHVSWLDIQRRHRAEFYLSMCEKLPDQPTVHYLAASYLYLLGDEAASRYLTQSFELMLLHDYTDCLHSHYRFFSAIEAKQGHLELAAAQYAITAFTDEERARAAEMQNWLDHGQKELLQAEICRVNEDSAAAIMILSGSSYMEAKPLLLLNYIETYQWEKALQLQREMEASSDAGVGTAAGTPPPARGGAAAAASQQLPVIEGTLHLLHGRRHAAIRSFLRAAGADHQARPLFAEMADLEEAVGRLRGRVDE